jgi:hypothetical protein
MGLGVYAFLLAELYFNYFLIRMSEYRSSDISAAEPIGR